MIQQQKTYRFSDDTIITEQNIRQIGELIALSSVRTRMIHSARDLYYVYQNLYKDVYCRNDILKPYSEAYDYAEEAYERYDKIIKTMNLPDYEYETLLAMMSGMRLIDMKRYFNVDYTTIYRRKIRIRKKYLNAVSALQ